MNIIRFMSNISIQSSLSEAKQCRRNYIDAYGSCYSSTWNLSLNENILKVFFLQRKVRLVGITLDK